MIFQVLVLNQNYHILYSRNQQKVVTVMEVLKMKLLKLIHKKQQKLNLKMDSILELFQDIKIMQMTQIHIL